MAFHRTETIDSTLNTIADEHSDEPGIDLLAEIHEAEAIVDSNEAPDADDGVALSSGDAQRLARGLYLADELVLELHYAENPIYVGTQYSGELGISSYKSWLDSHSTTWFSVDALGEVLDELEEVPTVREKRDTPF